MSWIISAISAYLILAIVFLVDKYLLSKSIPDPKIYSFYVGILGGAVLLLALFVNFYIPNPFVLFLALLAGIAFIYGLFLFFAALHLFEASRVVPAVGGLTPLFSLGTMYLFSGGQEKLTNIEFFALFLLVFGSVLISYKKTKISYKSLLLSTIAAFLLGLYFTLSKYVYLEQPFWNGFLWIRIGAVIAAFSFLVFFPNVRKEISNWFRMFFLKRIKLAELKFQKTTIIFVSNQMLGGGAGILQNLAIFLAPAAYISLVAALQGSQYLFLFVFALILSLKFPQIIKEEISKKIILQKISAILLISGGIIILAI